MDRNSVTSGGRLFQVAAARYRNARCVQVSRHRGSSRRPASVERVERQEIADRATNMDGWKQVSVRHGLGRLMGSWAGPAHGLGWASPY